MTGAKITRGVPRSVALLGVPLDENSSFRRGARQAPAAVRQALTDGASNLTTERGVDLDGADWYDAGDLELSSGTDALGQSSGTDALGQITRGVDECLGRRERVLSIGGDHSIAYPILRAYGQHHSDLTVVQLDAHPDLYDELDGNRFSHACPFARVLEERLVGRLVQIGIRTLNFHQRQQAERFGVEMVEAWHDPLASLSRLALCGPIYLSIDLDVLDPAFAPGVSHHEPGGLTTRQVLTIVQSLPGPIVGADVVELNPERDHEQMTARVASKLVKELLARLLE